MKIWVDADACPVPIKDILFRAAERKQLATCLVANHPMRIPPSPYIRLMQVSSGFDVADNEIVRLLQPGDLVVTGDIPLASQVIDKGGMALNPRGHIYTADNIRESLSMRDLMEELRSSGVQTGGPSALAQRDRQAFANALDQILARAAKA
ncbi:MAG: YaiI/YqxD family protein [Oceanococcus sp.]